MSSPADASERVFDYSRLLLPDDFDFYHTVPHGDLAVATFIGRTVVEPALDEVRQRFGISVNHLTWGELPEQSSRVPYVLVAPVNPLRLSHSTKEHLASMVTQRGARVNLVSAIPYGLGQDIPEYIERAATLIPAQDKELGINTIFPDTTDGLYYGLRTNTARDVADNIVCETIRLKYQANRVEDEPAVAALTEAQREAAPDIEGLSKVFREYGLWHRSETDGAFLVHTKNGWLTTQTKTDKTAVTPDNLSLITAWSAQNNSVDYVGRKLPSSDVPEFLVVGDYARDRLKGHQNVRLVVHFHHNPTVRGGGFDNLRTPGLIEYGRFSSGQEIIDNMKHKGDNGLILTEHGIVWIGQSVEQFEDYVANKLAIAKVK